MRPDKAQDALASLSVATTALRTLHESKCMNAWGHMIAGDALRTISEPRSAPFVLVTRAFLESLVCPNPSCSGGMIVNTGPDPQHDGCEWCEARDRFLAGELPLST